MISSLIPSRAVMSSAVYNRTAENYLCGQPFSPGEREFHSTRRDHDFLRTNRSPSNDSLSKRRSNCNSRRRPFTSVNKWLWDGFVVQRYGLWPMAAKATTVSSGSTTEERSRVMSITVERRGPTFNGKGFELFEQTRLKTWRLLLPGAISN